MSRILILFLFTLPFSIFAQDAWECGTNYEEGLLIREQMFRNRENVSLSHIRNFQLQSFNIYIPVVIHLVANSNGQGFLAEQNVVSMMCRLNNDFSDQNLYFYIKDSIRHVYDDTIFADAYDSVAIDRMILLKDTAALNIFVNGSAGGGVAGYYSRRGDFVFMLNAYANGGSTTITHEVGHFFTLPHTFFGWENINARQLYNNSPAPDSIGSDWRRREVEYVDRSGPLANCYSSADGFCDTDADYISERAQCPLSGIALDPSGTAISPNTNLYMSYFYDACVNSFSQEQKIAIMASVIERNWTFFPSPNIDSLNWNAIQHQLPLNGSSVTLDDSISFEWSNQSVGTADYYILRVERLIFGTPVGVIFNKNIGNVNSVKLPASLFLNGASYRWQLMPYSVGYHCSGFSQSTEFTVELESNIRSNDDKIFLDIFPNPLTNGRLNLHYNLPESIEVSIRIYSIDGRFLFSSPSEIKSNGSHFEIFDTSFLPSGHYILQILTQKFVKNVSIIVP